MVSKIEIPKETRLDGLKWLLAVLLTVSGLYANYYYSQQAWPLRFLAGLVVLGVVLGIISQTKQGIMGMVFARDSRMELRKVVWPTRQDTVKMTFRIAGIVFILGLILWVMDTGLLWLMGWLTGQRG